MQKLNVSCPDSSHTIRKFTFKKDKPIGLFRAFEGAWTDIKLNKRIVGYITETRSHHFVIYFAIERVPTKQNPATFKWLRIKEQFISEEEARKFVRNNNKKIQSTYDLRSFENWK